MVACGNNIKGRLGSNMHKHTKGKYIKVGNEETETREWHENDYHRLSNIRFIINLITMIRGQKPSLQNTINKAMISI